MEVDAYCAPTRCCCCVVACAKSYRLLIWLARPKILDGPKHGFLPTIRTERTTMNSLVWFRSVPHCRIELRHALTEVTCRYTNVVLVPVPAPGYFHFYKGIPLPRVLCHGRTALKRVAGTGNTPGMVRYVPYRTQHFHLQKFGYG